MFDIKYCKSSVINITQYVKFSHRFVQIFNVFSIPDIQIQEMKGENNNKGNAIIMQKPKIVGLKDIFTSEYETGSTSQEEMDSNSIDFDDTITNVNM